MKDRVMYNNKWQCNKQTDRQNTYMFCYLAPLASCNAICSMLCGLCCLCIVVFMHTTVYNVLIACTLCISANHYHKACLVLKHDLAVQQTVAAIAVLIAAAAAAVIRHWYDRAHCFVSAYTMVIALVQRHHYCQHYRCCLAAVHALVRVCIQCLTIHHIHLPVTYSIMQ